MSSGFRTGLIYGLKDSQDDQAFKDAVARMDDKFNYGSTAPGSDTPGKIYFKHGSSATDSVTVYIKIGNTWYGG